MLSDTLLSVDAARDVGVRDLVGFKEDAIELVSDGADSPAWGFDDGAQDWRRFELGGD